MMNSPVVCDLAAPSAAADFFSTHNVSKEAQPKEPFGAILREATSSKLDESADTDPQKISAEDQNGDKDKKKEDVTAVAPLFCFCPPPTIETPIAPVSQSAGGPAPALEAPKLAQPSEIAPATEAKGETDQGQNSSAKSATELVKPKAESAEAAKSSGKIELDPTVFEPVSEEVAAVEVTSAQSAKAQKASPTPVQNASHGTLVAQLENRVKSTEKTAEIAPAIEQKMPVRDVFRRAVTELGRVEAFHADKQAHTLTADFEVAAAETAPVKSIDAVQLADKIRTEVTNLRVRGDSTMTVTLRPDSRTELSLDVSIARGGAIHVVARCERGDFQNLNVQWPQLQQSLASHGIRIADLTNQNSGQQQNHQNSRSPEFLQNFDHGQNPKQHEERETANFEEQFAATKSKFSAAKPQPQTAARASSRRWQSWA